MVVDLVRDEVSSGSPYGFLTLDITNRQGLKDGSMFGLANFVSFPWKPN